MTGSVNKVILIGNLGGDPETKRLENGTVLSRIRIATSETYIDKSSGQKKEVTDWHTIVLWRSLGEIAEKYLKKGAKVYIEGKLKTRTWQDDQMNMHYDIEIVADKMTMLTRPDSGNNISSNKGGYGQPEPQSNNIIQETENDFLDDDTDILPF